MCKITSLKTLGVNCTTTALYARSNSLLLQMSVRCTAADAVSLLSCAASLLWLHTACLISTPIRGRCPAFVYVQLGLMLCCAWFNAMKCHTVYQQCTGQISILLFGSYAWLDQHTIMINNISSSSMGVLRHQQTSVVGYLLNRLSDNFYQSQSPHDTRHSNAIELYFPFFPDSVSIWL